MFCMMLDLGVRGGRDLRYKGETRNDTTSFRKNVIQMATCKYCWELSLVNPGKTPHEYSLGIFR